MTIKTISQSFYETKNRPLDWVACRYKVDDHWQSFRWNEIYHLSESIAAGLTSLGISSKAKIAIMSQTRFEWVVFDMAIMGLNCATIPLYHSQLPEEMAYILNHSEAEVLVLENYDQWVKWQSIHSQCPKVQNIILIDSHPDIEGVHVSWEKLMALGQHHLEVNPLLFETSISNQSLDDLATIIYTSGTTGEPKGVPLKHLQIASEVNAVLSRFSFTHQDTSLCFLPFAHVLGRLEAWCGIVSGMCLAFAEDIDHLRENLLVIKPTVLIAVPRVFEKLQSAILTQLESNSLIRRVFEWSMTVGKEVSQASQKKQGSPLLISTQNRLIQKLVFAKVREKLGGRLRFAVSGGAPLKPDLGHFFHAMGILILEGYGLTETTAAIVANTPLEYKFGTVGRPLPGVDIQLAEDGEILVKAPQVTEGYFKYNSESADHFQNEYFKTGDIGEWDEDGFLKITDRKKDLLKTSGGKYVAPQKLESMIKEHKLISQVLIIGDNEKYIVALVALNPPDVLEYAKKSDLSYQDYATLTQHPQIKALVRAVFSEVNSHLPSYESIKNFAIMPREFSLEEGEMTPSLKIKRKYCLQKYKDLVASLYS